MKKRKWNIEVTMTEIEEDTVQMTLDEWVKNAPTLDDFSQREAVEQAIIEEALEIISRPIWKEPWMDQVEEVKVNRGNPYDPKHWYEGPELFLSGLGPIETPEGSPKTLFKKKGETWNEARARSGGFEEE